MTDGKENFLINKIFNPNEIHIPELIIVVN